MFRYGWFGKLALPTLWLFQIAAQRFEHAPQALSQHLHARGIEQAGVILQPQLQALAGQDRETQRVMRDVAAVNGAHAQRRAGLAALVQRVGIDGVVLEHHQGIEELAQAG